VATDPLTRTDLDRMRCQEPSCVKTGHANGHEHVVMNSRCHPKRPLIARYWGDGVLETWCKICNTFVASFAVTPEDETRLNGMIACDDPACAHPPAEHKLLVVAQCHRGAGIYVIYEEHGQLVFYCSKCRSAIGGVHLKEASVH
jgi:hypothetical protein